MLLHLVDDDPAVHIEVVPSTGELRARGGSPRGAETISFFQLDDYSKSRLGVWDAIVRHLERYDEAVRGGLHAEADRLKSTILGFDHRSLLSWLVQIASGPNGAILTSVAIPAIVAQHQVDQWR